MIKLKSRDEIERIRECGIISAGLFKYLQQYIHPGITTQEIDRIAETYIRAQGATPSFKGYSGFPSSVCASVNEEVIHGLPCSRVLKEGDIIGIDVGVRKNGMISDSAMTFPVGDISNELKLLLERTERALYKGIAQVKMGCSTNDIGGAIHDYAQQFNYGIVRDYCGHGVGYKNHEEPEVPNYRVKKGGKKLKSNTVLAIEPMINLGDDEVFVLEDGWTVVTIDGKYSAHFEHTVAVTDNGFDILTIDPDDLDEIKKKFFK